MSVKVCDGKYAVSVKKGKFSVFGNSYNTSTLSDSQAEWLIAQGWEGIKKVPAKKAEKPEEEV